MRDFAGLEPDYDGDPHGKQAERRPLRKIFDGLREQVDAVVLLGTTNADRPGSRSFYAYARQMQRQLTADVGLCGRRFEPGGVSVVAVAEPSMQATREAVAGLLAERRPTECLVTTGSGAYAMSLGALLAAIETGTTVRLVHVDAADEPYEIACQRDPDRYLASWLIRHRYWSELAAVDPEHEKVWELLAQRQRGETTLARTLSPSGGPGVTAREARTLAKRQRTVQAATYERAGRGEVVDNGLLRAWFTQTLRQYCNEEKESGSLPPDLPNSVIALLEKISGDFDGGLRSQVKRASADAARITTSGSRVVRMLRDQRLVNAYAVATEHVAPGLTTHLPLPPTLIAAVDTWERGDVAPEMVARAGFVTWPVLGSGDVLALMGVGLAREGRDEEDRQAIRTVLEHLHRRRQGLARPGKARLRLVASEETAERAHALAEWARSLLIWPGDDAEVIGPLPAGPRDIGTVHHGVLAALRAGASPTGRIGSSSLRDIDEAVLVLNPGTAATNYGLTAAGVDWSLEAACTLRVVELARRAGMPPDLRGGPSVLCRLGPDRMLTHLAASALRRLDANTAVRLLAPGSSALAPIGREVERLAHALVADLGNQIGFEPCKQLTCARWRLIAHALGDQPEPAAYLAVEVARPLLGRSRWARLARGSEAMRDLVRLRDHSAYGHLVERLNRGHGGRAPRRDIRRILNQAINDLKEGRAFPDDHLVTRYGDLLQRLDRLSG